MNKIGQRKLKESKEFFNRKILLDSLLCNLENLIIQTKQDNKIRDLGHIKRVINFLFNLKWEISENCEDKLQERNNKVDDICENAALFGYTFFLQSYPQFSYNWSYLRKKIDSYREFLINFQNFVDLVIGDINEVYKNIRIDSVDIKFVVNDYIIIEHANNVPYLNAKLDIENFYQISQTTKDTYNLKILLGSTTLAVFARTQKTDLLEIAKYIQNVVGKE